MNTSIKKVKELLGVLDPYAELWHEWKVSGACFLTEQEIVIIQTYLLTGSHFTSANQLGISPGTAASILINLSYASNGIILFFRAGSQNDFWKLMEL